MSLSVIKIQQSFPQLLTHYPRLCLQIRRRRVKACVDLKQLWGSYVDVGSINSPYLPLCAAAFIKVEHALMHTHPRPRPHPYPCPCACITHSGVNNSNGEDKNKHQRHLINAATRNFNNFFAVLPPSPCPFQLYICFVCSLEMRRYVYQFKWTVILTVLWAGHLFLIVNQQLILFKAETVHLLVIVN